MPINGPLRRQILNYCRRDTPDSQHVLSQYSFIEDAQIRTAVVDELLTARYIYKLGEALAVEKKDLEAHSKFQITQYAAVYEAVIGWMLWDKLACHPEVESLMSVKSMRRVAEFPKSINAISDTGQRVFLAEEKTLSVPQQKVKFSDKVKVSVSLGFLDEKLAVEVNEFFAARNGIHIENAVKNNIEYELDLAKRAYWRLQPFSTGIRVFCETGKLPSEARIK